MRLCMNESTHRQNATRPIPRRRRRRRLRPPVPVPARPNPHCGIPFPPAPPGGAKAHQLLIEALAVEQHAAQLDRARAELHVELLEVELAAQVAPDAALEHELEHAPQRPVGGEHVGSAGAPPPRAARRSAQKTRAPLRVHARARKATSSSSALRLLCLLRAYDSVISSDLVRSSAYGRCSTGQQASASNGKKARETRPMMIHAGTTHKRWSRFLRPSGCRYAGAQ